MVSLPINTPEPVTNFCLSCESNEAVVNKLQENTDLFIQFFKTVSEDSTWMDSNTDLVDKMVSHLDTLSQSGNLSLNQARTVRLTAQVAAATFDSETVKDFASDDVKFTVSGGEVVNINHTLLCSESSYFTKLLMGSFKEVNKEVTFPEMDVNTLSLLKEFLETGKIDNLEEEDANDLIKASSQYLMPNLLFYLAENHMSLDNLMDFVTIAYLEESESTRDICFKFIEDNFEGIKISAEGFRDMTVTIEKYSEELERLTPFFDNFNPDVEEANVPSDFKLAVNIGRDALRLDLEEAEAASATLFKMLPYARTVDLSNAVPLDDSVVLALGMSCPKLDSVNLKGSRYLTDKSVSFLAEKCMGLKSINLDGCSKLTDASLQAIAKCSGDKLLALNLDNLPFVSDLGIGSIAELCPNLRHLGFGNADAVTDKAMELIAGNLKNVEELKFSHCASITPKGLQMLIGSLPLKKLSIAEHRTQNGEKALITPQFLQHIAKDRGDIQELIFSSQTDYRGRRELTDGVGALAESCTQLTAIEFIPSAGISQGNTSRNYSLDSTHISSLINNNPNLQRIDLGSDLTDNHLTLIAGKCPQLKAINLTSCAVTDAALLELSEKCQHLESLALGWNDITNDNFIQLVDNCPSLKSLELLICTGIKYTGVEHAIKNLPLEKLVLLPGEGDFESFRPGHNAPHPFIKTQTLALLPQYCPNLRVLAVRRRSDCADSSAAMAQIGANCHNLEKVYFQGARIVPGMINHLLGNNQKLFQIEIERDVHNGEAFIRGVDLELLKSHPSLKTFKIKESYEISDLGTEVAEGVENVKIDIHK